MYMNRTKRNLIMASAILNIISNIAYLVLSIIAIVNIDFAKKFIDFYYIFGYSSSIIYAVISFVIGIVGSILLLWSVRSKGKYYRTSYGIYIAGFVIIVVCGGSVSWVLLFISAFIPDIVVINSRGEIHAEERREKREEILRDRAYEDKKAKIEELKRLRDSGAITEEEYKNKLFDLL